MINVGIEPRWTLSSDSGQTLDGHCLPLLQAIARGGSLQSAARTVGLSYRHAWNLLHDWEHVFGTPLVLLQRGRGARLTPLGLQLLRADQRMQARLTPTLMTLAAELETEINQTLEGGRTTRLRLHASHGFAIACLREALERRRDSRWELQFRSTMDALAALFQRNCEVAAIHVPCVDHSGRDPHSLKQQALAAWEPWLSPEQRVIPFVRRCQGLMLPPGNPAGIRGLEDLAETRLRFVNRQSGSGSRALFDALLSRARVASRDLRGYQHEEFTHAAVAAFVASGMADVGFGIEAAARQFDLGFIPLVDEHYSLICWADFLDSEPAAGLLEQLGDRRFGVVIDAIPGYRWVCDGTARPLASAFPADP